CSGLTSVTIPESVTSIGESAFSGCSGLTSVTIPEGVTSIGDLAFSGCSGLTSVTIPESVASIGDYAFEGVAPEALTAAWLPSGMSKDNLKTLVIPESVTSIGDLAFSGCSGLTSVTIPSSVTSIGYNAFYNCSGLTSVTIPSSVTSIEGWAFEYCTGLTSVTIPSSVTSIGEYAFSGCSGLTSIIFTSIPPTHLTNLATEISGAKGYYFPEYTSAWESVIKDGKWNGVLVDVLPEETIGTLTITPISPFGKVIIVYSSEALKDATIFEDFVLSCYDETTGETYEAKAIMVTKSLSSGAVTFEWDMAKDGIRLDAASLRFYVEYCTDL
ncbi:MAG: leucine-rich repeat domain-containing protein, partial [Kiritimatiellae bacterium]|nr:leucine-rich repeat domain-containing protein [Kiritimatiellia bacterium]